MSKGKALLASIFLLVSGVSLSDSLSANCGWGGCPDNYCPECDMYYGAPEYRDYRGPRFRGYADRPYWREYARENYRVMREDDGFYRDDRRDGFFRRDRFDRDRRDMRDDFLDRREDVREERREERREALRDNASERLNDRLNDRRAIEERRRADGANK